MPYVENPGWEAKLLRNPQGRAALRAVANTYKDHVAHNVPVHTGDLQGWYEETGRVRSGKLSYGVPTMEYWTGVHIYHIIEWGSIHNPPYAPLRRTSDELGLKWSGR